MIASVASRVQEAGLRLARRGHLTLSDSPAECVFTDMTGSLEEYAARASSLFEETMRSR
jgi:hypothetical protein